MSFENVSDTPLAPHLDVTGQTVVFHTSQSGSGVIYGVLAMGTVK